MNRAKYNFKSISVTSADNPCAVSLYGLAGVSSVLYHFEKLVILSASFLYLYLLCFRKLKTVFSLDSCVHSFTSFWLFSIYFLLFDSFHYLTSLLTLSFLEEWWTECPECLFNLAGNLSVVLVQQRWMNLTAKWYVILLLSFNWVMSHSLLDPLLPCLKAPYTLLQMPWDVAWPIASLLEFTHRYYRARQPSLSDYVLTRKDQLSLDEYLEIALIVFMFTNFFLL